VNRQSGVGDSKYVVSTDPVLIDHVIWRMQCQFHYRNCMMQITFAIYWSYKINLDARSLVCRMHRCNSTKNNILGSIMRTIFKVKGQGHQVDYCWDRKCVMSSEWKDLRTSNLGHIWSMGYQLPRPTTKLDSCTQAGIYRVGRTRPWPHNLLFYYYHAAN